MTTTTTTTTPATTPADALTDADILDIANTAAGHWVKRGVSASHFDDLRQEAARIVIEASAKWRAEAGQTRKVYCYIVAERELRHRFTRWVAPASARGRSSMRQGVRVCVTTEIGRLTTVPLSTATAEHTVASGGDDDAAIALDGADAMERAELAGVLAKAAADILAGEVERGKLDNDTAQAVLSAVCGVISAEEVVSRSGLTRRMIYTAMQRVRRSLREALAPTHDAWTHA